MITPIHAEHAHMLLNLAIETFKTHEVLTASVLSAAGGVRLGVWIQSIRTENVAKEAQQRHDQDLDRLDHLSDELNIANARVTQTLNLLEDWNKRPVIAISAKPENYVEAGSARRTVDDFQDIVMGHTKPHSRLRKHLPFLNRRKVKQGPGGHA
jgi:hypothetical protein